MKLILFLFLNTYLFATLSSPIHSSVSTYYETKSYTNSKQKIDGKVYGVGLDIHHNNSKYKLTYESGATNTKQPPLDDNLKFQKLYLRYAYKYTTKIDIHLNYIHIINDNIALTDDGQSYGFGLIYFFTPKNRLDLTQYYSNYRDFKVYQSDAHFDYLHHISQWKIKFSCIGKYIKINDKRDNSFTHYAKNHYETLGLKLHIDYKSYHFATGTYIGKRSFAIMNNGFKIQHHAMEFDRTYAIGLGKSFSKFVFRTQYIYQRATEIPIQNNNVIIKNIRFIVNYKF